MTGELTFGQIVFVPRPLRVTALSAEVGTAVAAGSGLLTSTSTTLGVTAALDPATAAPLRAGNQVVVTTPDGRRGQPPSHRSRLSLPAPRPRPAASPTVTVPDCDQVHPHLDSHRVGRRSGTRRDRHHRAQSYRCPRRARHRTTRSRRRRLRSGTGHRHTPPGRARDPRPFRRHLRPRPGQRGAACRADRPGRRLMSLETVGAAVWQ